MGFHLKWVNWIMHCVTSVTYSVLINNHPHGFVTPQRGLRQGDPISPFLFVLCAEGLTHLLHKAERNQSFDGIRFAPQGPAVTHLLFADDSLFLSTAKEENALVLNNILQAYGSVTGQFINLSKSSITFGIKLPDSLQVKIRQILGIVAEGGHSKYLGLPECLSGSKVKLFSFIKDRVQSRISGWFAKMLSPGGKEVLMKIVLSALPVYAMSVFKLPKTVCDSLARAMADFWWHNVDHKRKIHWLSWDKLCLPKSKGGLGFRDFACFNKALLAKQGWRILTQPECLMAQVLRSRYFPDDTFVNASLGSRPSYAWRSILYGRDLLNSGLKVIVGNGRSLRVWCDPWLEDVEGTLRAPYRKEQTFNVNLMVSELIDVSSGRWNPVALESVFVRNDIQTLLRNQPSINRSDGFVWRFTLNGCYSVSSGYQLAFNSHTSEALQTANTLPSLNGLKAKVWCIKAPSKIKIFMWKALSGALAVDDLLASRGMKSEGLCQVCGEMGESINHLLFTCSLSRQIWALTDFPHPRGGFDPGSVFANFNFLCSVTKKHSIAHETTRIFPWILWYIWKNRNALIFEGKFFNPQDSVAKIKEEADLWFVAQSIPSSIPRSSNNDSTTRRRCSDITRWRPPRPGWLKCNIGVAWSKRTRIGGLAWVLRDSTGGVVLHSRRSMSNINSFDEAQFLGFLWAVESMVFHHVSKVVFAVVSHRVKDAILRPIAWPSFSTVVGEINLAVRNFLDWNIFLESKSANRGAYLIARSATAARWHQSYVASNHPLWLDLLFRS